ncbi:hypothetical protein QNO21_01930 [Microbacterium sp. zg-Y818]|uniref:hypothetical protein n=1 Tax=unclassified Microbacterium TaxID=2609290 RepID=UPI00214B87FF|nr:MULTISPECIES: hypothetical protein [unclassified Microbacterium]MCR2801923.1 hypothetical protein [Microbacterium sp. zg.Y818]WIM22820.1 hypothetical protein QNO21_01930 [Microbacterium sp. zg-Y818]
MIDPMIGVVFVALATVNAAVMIGLGFLHRPSQAGAVWVFSFTLAMVTAYGWVAADATGSLALRAGCAGALLGSTMFVWTGLRTWRGAPRTYTWVAAALTVVLCVVLPLAASAGGFGVAFRFAFALAALVAALTLVELVRAGSRQRHKIMPLALASAGFIVLAAVYIVEGLMQGAPAPGTDGLQLMRELNSMTAILYGQAATVTLLLLTREGAPAPRVTAAETPFCAVARDRLRRAEAVGDRWWCVLDVRLDDPGDLREAFSATEFARIADRFARDVRETLPPDADVDVRDETRVVVLLPRPEGAVRQLLSRLLDQVATPDPGEPVAVRRSASIGWASVEAVGYDLDHLLDAAQAAGADAQRHGGDRWERVAAPVG